MKALTEPEGLREHITSTYFSLRVATAVIGFALPIVLYVVGRFSGVHLQRSLSDYYPHGTDATRSLFVGALFAVGACLYAYKGFSNLENISLNIAGVLAPLIGLFRCQCDDPNVGPTPHGVFAVSFFVVIAFVCIKCAPDTLELMESSPEHRAKAESFRRLYRVIGVVMLASPAIAAAISFSHDGTLQNIRIFIEVVGIYTFAFYWLVKSRELLITAADELVSQGRAKRSKRGVVKTNNVLAGV